MATDNFNPKVDAYINKAKPFAQPILEHIRELVHKACPAVEETIKWSRPFFEYKGAILGNMSAFKEHCSFGFWGEEIGAVLREAKRVAPRMRWARSAASPASKTCRPTSKCSPGSARPPPSSTAATTPAPSRRETKSSKRPNARTRNSSRIRHSPQEKQESRRRLRRLQSQLQTRIRRMDRRSQTRRNPRQANRHRHRVDRRRQTAQLEIPELLTCISKLINQNCHPEQSEGYVVSAMSGSPHSSLVLA